MSKVPDTPTVCENLQMRVKGYDVMLPVKEIFVQTGKVTCLECAV
jgi:hypothetical protein